LGKPAGSCKFILYFLSISAEREKTQKDFEVDETMKKLSHSIGVGFGGILLLAAGLAAGCHKAETTGASASMPEPATPAVAQRPEDKMPRIKAPEAMKAVADGAAVLIDVRGTDAYRLQHIKGSLDVPLQKLEGKDFMNLPKDKQIIAYCTCPTENSSARAALLLDQGGYKNVAALVGGLHAWEAAGGAIEKAPPPKK
jgi:rhodanese-related sulfurtransferase